MTVRLDGESLNWIVRFTPACFYPTEWFRAEPFAQASIVGVFSAGNWPWPAAACAAEFVQAWETNRRMLWPDHYVWTSDKDHEGNRVYVGRAAQYGGLQVHRLLTPEIRE